MDLDLNVTFIGVLIGAFIVCLVIVQIVSPQHDKTEPPLITPSIPVFGHIIGLVRKGQTYYTQLSAKHDLPIYTLHMLNGRTYVVNDPDLVVAVNRNSKAISFMPIATNYAPRITGASKHATEIIKHIPPPGDKEVGCATAVFKDMHATLMPGPDLDAMNRMMIENLGTVLDAFQDGREVDLYKWSRSTITLASTDAAFGPGNPFRTTPSLEDDFWAFEKGTLMLLLNFFPQLTCRSAYLGREKLVSALTKYFENGDVEKGSGLVKVRYNGHTRYGIQPSDSARFDCTNLIGIFVNTVPSTFWMIARIFSSDSLLADLRDELASVMTTQTKDGSNLRVLDITSIKTCCPLLLSVWQEVLRIHSGAASGRVVLQDTLLADKYLLKKDAIVQMPTAAIHFNTSIYGNSARSFEPRRFMPTKSGERKLHPGAVRTFGGGAWLCPGRHFVTTEVLAITAMLVMRYDIRPVAGNGEWVLPTTNKTDSLAAIIPPDYDVRVNITTRKGFEDDQWDFLLTDSNEQALSF